jgi:hypothetical protein
MVEWPAWDGVSYAARWHYLCLVQACSRAQRWDGRLPETRASRVSDVDKPVECVVELVNAGLLYFDEGDVVIVRIEDHIPPKSIRNNANDSKIRMQRKRAHDRGDHSLCLPKRCPKATVTGAVTSPVTRNARTGQDRTATTATTNSPELSETNPSPANPPWPPTARPGQGLRLEASEESALFDAPERPRTNGPGRGDLT